MQVALVSFILVTSILANVFYGPFTILYGKRAFFENKEYIGAGNKMISLIPKDASVSAVNWAGPHLSQREVLFVFPAPYRQMGKSALMREYEEKGAEYFLLDFSDAFIDPSRGGGFINMSSVNMLVNDKGYGIISAQNTWVLFKKGASYEQNICLIKPFLSKEKYPYLNIKIEDKDSLKKCK